MGATFVVYVDESGDEGFLFDSGSSEWFVLSAVITRKAKDLGIVKLADRVRAQLGRPKRAPLHFRKLKHERRLAFVAEIANAELRTVSVLVHKPSLKEPEKFQKRHRLYFYTARYLLERISWYCRDHRMARDSGDGSAETIFSYRGGMSYEELKEYLSHLQKRTGLLDTTIEWSVIKTGQITACPPYNLAGLQIVDAVAGSFYHAVEPSPLGFTEDRYARMLKPVVYNRRGRYLGYGLKLWPGEVNDLLKAEGRFRWLETEYKKSAGPGPQDPTH